MSSHTVKQLHPDDQPRERAIRYGIGSLSVPDLLAIILRTGIPGKPITAMCREIMEANSNRLARLERRTRAELMAIPGIGQTKAIQIEAVMEIIRRYASELPDQKPPLDSSERVYSLMGSVIGNLDHEEIWVLCLDRGNRLVARHRITSGTSTASLFDARMILKHAILENAESIIMCHNHPSGQLRSSSGDDNITIRLQKACETVGIRMLDHIIITASGFYSYADNCRL